MKKVHGTGTKYRRISRTYCYNVHLVSSTCSLRKMYYTINNNVRQMMVCLGLNSFVDNQTNVQCTLLIKHVPIIITH